MITIKDFAETKFYGMGTQMAYRAIGRRSEKALRAVQAASHRLERLLSRFIPESDIARLNCAAGVRCENISAETFAVLREALRLSELSDGLFDPTVGPLVDVWDYKHAVSPPADKTIKEAVSIVNFRDLELHTGDQTGFLKKCGQSLDLGGIGKGFASDCFMQIFKKCGLSSAFSNIGGNVSTLGSRPDGSAWRVGIRHPRNEGLIGAVEVINQAVVTSGDYERFFTDRFGRRYHHILNPRTGYPAMSGLISVTIVCDSAITADALSTAVFVAGLDIGIELIKKIPTTQAVLIDKDLNVYFTAGLRGGLRISTNHQSILI
ncbi:FAD:protein FMN transferase [Oscillospiraceae bacterium WX1]